MDCSDIKKLAMISKQFKEQLILAIIFKKLLKAYKMIKKINKLALITF